MEINREWNGPKVAESQRESAHKGVELAMEHLLTESLKLVPIEEGTLANSGRVDVDGLTGVVAYDTPYAVRQHEDLSMRHDRGRQAKYLEEPMDAEAEAMRDIIAEQLKRGLS